jgi:hypothetical protein
MEPIRCNSCGHPLGAHDILSCPMCGEPLEPEKAKKVGPFISLFGALFLGAAPFFPWLTYGLENVSGVEETRYKALILAGMAAFAAMFSLSALTGKKFTGLRGNIINGLAAVGLAVYYYVELEWLIGENGAPPQFGSGIYFALAGAALVLVGGLATRSPKVQKTELS